MSETPPKHRKRFKQTATNVYHTVEQHRARALNEDVKGVVARFKDWFGLKVDNGQRWYQAQSLVLKVVYGFTIVPVLLLLGLLGVLMVKFGGPILLVLALTAKFLIVTSKIVFFIGYVTYKMLKTVLILYYVITRFRNSHVEAKRRHHVIAEQSLPIDMWDGSDGYQQVQFEHQWKNITLSTEQHSLPVLCSYLRYAIEAQKCLFSHIKQDWRAYLTLWRTDSLAIVKAAFSALATAVFKPHQLGDQVFKGQALVLGDAQLQKVRVAQDHTIQLDFLVKWVDWTVSWQKSWRFLSIRRQCEQTVWVVKAPSN